MQTNGQPKTKGRFSRRKRMFAVAGAVLLLLTMGWILRGGSVPDPELRGRPLSYYVSQHPAIVLTFSHIT